MPALRATEATVEAADVLEPQEEAPPEREIDDGASSSLSHATPPGGGGVLAAVDCEVFSVADMDKGNLLTLACLPIVWASMVVIMQQLTRVPAAGVAVALSPALCTFGTQLLTIPLFSGLFLATPRGSGATAGGDEGGGEGGGGGADDDAPFGPLVRNAGLALGSLWMVGGFIQTQGFASGASASHGAFLTQMTTLLVPLAQLVRGDAVNPKFLVACALALPGIACFALDSAGGGDVARWRLTRAAFPHPPIDLASRGGSDVARW